MILGMSTATFTQFHVFLSLVGIVSGIVVVLAMLGANRFPLLTAMFLLTTVATSVTGFMFHFASFGPPEIIGAISLVVLAVALLRCTCTSLPARGAGSMSPPRCWRCT